VAEGVPHDRLGVPVLHPVPVFALLWMVCFPLVEKDFRAAALSPVANPQAGRPRLGLTILQKIENTNLTG
jgi:hypothetical protein